MSVEIIIRASHKLGKNWKFSGQGTKRQDISVREWDARMDRFEKHEAKVVEEEDQWELSLKLDRNLTVDQLKTAFVNTGQNPHEWRWFLRIPDIDLGRTSQGSGWDWGTGAYIGGNGVEMVDGDKNLINLMRKKQREDLEVYWKIEYMSSSKQIDKFIIQLIKIPGKSTGKYRQEIVDDLTSMGFNEDMSVAAAQRNNTTDTALEWINQYTKQRILLPLLPDELEHQEVGTGGGGGGGDFRGRGEAPLPDTLLKKMGMWYQLDRMFLGKEGNYQKEHTIAYPWHPTHIGSIGPDSGMVDPRPMDMRIGEIDPSTGNVYSHPTYRPGTYVSFLYPRRINPGNTTIKLQHAILEEKMKSLPLGFRRRRELWMKPDNMTNNIMDHLILKAMTLFSTFESATSWIVEQFKELPDALQWIEEKRVAYEQMLTEKRTNLSETKHGGGRKKSRKNKKKSRKNKKKSRKNKKKSKRNNKKKKRK